MSQPLERAAQWIYTGLWGVVTRWFRVPADPPMLPGDAGSWVRSFRPAEGYLRYLKLLFWVQTTFLTGAICLAWLIIGIASALAGLLVTPVALFLIVVPSFVVYLAIHLRYDTTWYVLSDRSLRIRRGIWVVHETTVTFENVQNVAVNQGPLQRYFGIANVSVQTAGGGGNRPGSGETALHSAAHQGLIEGVANAPEIRDLILNRLQKSRASGLGDDRLTALPTCAPWSPRHVELLREIRDAVRRWELEPTASR